MSTTEKNRSSFGIQFRGSELADQGTSMSFQRPKPRQNIVDENLEIDMLGWDTPEGKNLLTTRKARADARRKAQSPRR